MLLVYCCQLIFISPVCGSTTQHAIRSSPLIQTGNEWDQFQGPVESVRLPQAPKQLCQQYREGVEWSQGWWTHSQKIDESNRLRNRDQQA